MSLKPKKKKERKKSAKREGMRQRKTSLSDSESMIAGKTHSEILSMERNKRYRWRKTLLPEEKEKAMKITKDAGYAKIGAAHKDKPKSEESNIKRRMWWTPERKAESGAAVTGEKNPMYGKPKSEKTRTKISEAATGRVLSGKTKRQISATKQGITLEEWSGFVKEQPYCRLWTERLREHIRNLNDRTCTICGKSAIQNRQRLSVDHLDANKMQGCEDWEWRLTTLCKSCHGKMCNEQKHLLLQLLLLNNKRHQTNFLFGDDT